MEGWAPTGLSLFEPLDLKEWDRLADRLDERQRRLVESAITMHALVNPGRTLTYNVHMGEDWQYPRLTDEGRYHTQITEGHELLGAVRARSLVVPVSDFSVPMLTSEGDVTADWNVRHLLVTPADATDETVQARHGLTPQVRLYRCLEERHPVILDRIREQFWRRYERDRDRYHGRRKPELEYRRLANVVPNLLPIPRLSGSARDGARPAVIVAMHWLQAGGAERWAIETVKLVKEAGLLPIVVTDHDSHQPWITRPELDGVLVLCLSHPMAGFPGDDPLLRALVEQFDIRGVAIHHCQWLYDRLPLLKLWRPDLEVVDSLHVLEFGGGFPRAAGVASSYITWHHTISKQIGEWLESRQRVAASKIVFAPLSRLTADGSGTTPPKVSGAVLTIAFIGRMARQKRPEAFLLLVKRSRAAGLNLRVIMHGDGELDGLVGRTISRYGLDEVVEVRSSAVPVSETLAEADLLILTSSAEGITLTTFEAIDAGVPVVSSDVGAQSEVIPADALVPRPTERMIPAALGVLRKLQDPERRADLLTRERAAVDALGKYPAASDWMKGVIERWAR